MHIKRIDPESIPGLYRDLGWTAVRGSGDGRDNCGCVLVAIWAAAGFPPEHYVTFAAKSYGSGYAQGVVDGFDGVRRPRDTYYSYSCGYADGRACWQALVREGLVEREAGVQT